MSSEETGKVTMRVDGHVAVITVENESKMNSYTPDLMRELAGHLTTLDEDDDLWVGVFCAAGKNFTAGLDMPKFFGPGGDPQPVRDGQVDPFGLTRRCRKPVVCAVQGITYTVGIEMMLACDIVVAADTTRFAQIESKRGIAPLGGAHFRYLTRTGWGDAMYHLFLCDEFDAEEAKRLGFVQEVVPFGQQVDRAIELAHAICKNAPLGIQATKEGAMAYIAEAEKAAIAEIERIQAKVLNTEDAKEGIQSFIERRDAIFRGR